MRRYNGSQIDQNEVLNNCCYVTSALIASTPKVTLLQLLLFLNASSTEHEIIEEKLKWELKWELGEKLFNSIMGN